MFTAATLLPAIAYAGTVLLYAGVVRHIKREPGYFHLGHWERPVVAGALIWLAYEFIILLGPDGSVPPSCTRPPRCCSASGVRPGVAVGAEGHASPAWRRRQGGARAGSEPAKDEPPRNEATFPTPNHPPSEDSGRAYLRG